MAKKGLAGVPIAPLIIIIVGIIAVLYILKNKNLFNFGAIAAPVAGQTTFGVCRGPADRAQWCATHPCLSSGEEAGGYITITNIDVEEEEVSQIQRRNT